MEISIDFFINENNVFLIKNVMFTQKGNCYISVYMQPNKLFYFRNTVSSKYYVNSKFTL